MRRRIARFAVIVLAASALLGGVLGSASAAPVADRGCRSGAIPSGTYRDLVVSGVCWIPDKETVTVTRNLIVRSGATLNGVGFANGKPDFSHFNMATIHIAGSVFVYPGAILGLGCSIAMGMDPTFPLCSKTHNSDVRIGGGLLALYPKTMYLDGIVVNGTLFTEGGGPGPNVTQMNPAYNFPIKDNTIHGSLWIVGWNGGWVGSIRNHVGGNLVYGFNRGVDKDANEVITNVVGRNLVCAWNTPNAQYGDARFAPGAAPNKVGGKALGECANLTKKF